MSLSISNEILQEMHSHAEADYPNECCGFFFGKAVDIRKVRQIYPVKNAKEDDQRRRFEIDPKDYQEAEKLAIENDLDLLGVYHSHPDHPAEPSEHDRRVAMPWFSYIIVSVQDANAGTTRSWRLNDYREFKEEQIGIIETESTHQQLHV